VEELSRQLESLQQNMQAKDQESQDKITKLKNEVKWLYVWHSCGFIDQIVCEREEGARGEAQG
jgi:ATP-dependent protease ClpP protease subunit